MFFQKIYVHSLPDIQQNTIIKACPFVTHANMRTSYVHLMLLPETCIPAAYLQKAAVTTHGHLN